MDTDKTDKLAETFDNLNTSQKLDFMQNEYAERLGDRWNDMSNEEFADELKYIEEYKDDKEYTIIIETNDPDSRNEPLVIDFKSPVKIDPTTVVVEGFEFEKDESTQNNVQHILMKKSGRTQVFPITSITRDDIIQVFSDKGEEIDENIVELVNNIEDHEMTWLASKLSDDYCEQLFWDSLKIIFDGRLRYDITKRQREANFKLKWEELSDEDKEVVKANYKADSRYKDDQNPTEKDLKEHFDMELDDFENSPFRFKKQGEKK